MALHQWIYGSRIPPPTGTIKSISPGRWSALAIAEIQKVINEIRVADSQNHYNWRYRPRIPLAGEVITGYQPGLQFWQSISEIQAVLDDMNDDPPAAGIGISDALLASYAEHRAALGQGASSYSANDPGLFKKRQWIHRLSRPVPGQIIADARPGLKIMQAIGEIQGAVNRLQGMTSPSDLLDEMREWINTYCTNFVNHSAGPFYNNNFLYFTPETFRALRGDFDTTLAEVIAGLNALKWTGSNVGWSRDFAFGEGSAFNDMGAAIATAETGWPSSGGVDPYETNPQAWTHKTITYDIGGVYEAVARIFRIRAAPTCSTASVPHTVALYLASGKPSGPTFPGVGTGWTYNANGDGVAESASYTLYSTSGVLTSASFVGDYIGASPLAKPEWCDNPIVEYTFQGASFNSAEGYSCSGKAIIKYQFTIAE